MRKVIAPPFRRHLSFFLILLVGIGIRLWHINWGLPEIYEEAMPLNISWKFWNFGNDGFSFNPHFFVYPAFTFYFQFLIQYLHYFIGHLFGYYRDANSFRQAYNVNPTAFVMLARMTTLLFDCGTIVITYFLTKEFFSTKIALISAVLIACNPLHIKETHLVNVDTPLTFFLPLSLFCIYKVYAFHNVKWYLLTGVAIGLAAASKYNGFLMLVLFCIVHLLMSKQGMKRLYALFNYKFLLAVIPAFIVFLICNPYIILDYHSFVAGLTEVQTHMELGHLGLKADQSTVGYYLFESLPLNLGWLFTITLFVSFLYCLYAIVQKQKRLFILCFFPVLYMLIICTWKMRADRYIFPVFPMFIIIGSVGIAAATGVMELYLKRMGRALHFKKTLLPGYVFLGLLFLIEPVYGDYVYHRSYFQPDTRTTAKLWIQENLPEESVIVMPPLGIQLDTTYTTFQMPFDAIEAERFAPFYDARWYEDFDLVVISDFDYSRFKQDPIKYQDYIRFFYDSLQTRWKLIKEITSNEYSNGPHIWMYKPHLPLQQKPYSDSLLVRMNDIENKELLFSYVDQLLVNLSLKSQGKKMIQTMTQLVITCINLELFDDAISVADKFLNIAPNYAPILGLKGQALRHLNRIEEAKENLERAIALNDTSSVTYYDLESIYIEQGETTKLINVLTHQLTVVPPKSGLAGLIQQKLEEIKANK